MPDVFISYAREDAKLVHRLNAALLARGRSTSLDVQDILPAEEWSSRIEALIAESNHFLLVISPGSAASTEVLKELAHAASLHKPILPLLARAVDPASLPEAVGKLQWLPLQGDGSAEEDVRPVLEALDVDPRWVRMHTRLSVRAGEWQNQGRNPAFFLRGLDLENAEAWLAQGMEKEPRPTRLQTEYVQESRAATTRRQRTTLIVMALGLVLALALALWAEINRRSVVEQKRVADQRLQETLRNQSLSLADTSRRLTAAGKARLGVLIALEALPRDVSRPNRPLVAQAEDSLYRALAVHREKRIFRTSGEWVSSVALSPDGRFLAASSGDDTRLWETGTGKLVHVLSGSSSKSIRFSPGGDRLVTASLGGPAQIWETATGRLLSVLQHGSDFGGGVEEAIFSPDGTLVATASQDGTAGLWQTATGLRLATLGGHRGTVKSLAFSRDGRRLVTASVGNTARLWDVATGRRLAMLRGDPVTSHPAFPSTTSGLSGRVSPTVLTGQKALFLPAAAVPNPKDLEVLEKVEVSPDGGIVLAASQDGRAWLWDTATHRRKATLLGHEGEIWQATFSPDGHRILTASRDGTARVWDASTGHSLLVLAGHENDVVDAAFSPDGERIVTASNDHSARLWDAETGEILATFREHEGPVVRVVFSPDGKTVATAAWDWTARLWDALPSERIAILRGHRGEIWKSEFSPDGRLIMTASGDRMVRLWDGFTGRPSLIFQGHTGRLLDAAFSPKGNRIVTASEDRTAAVWDVATGHRLVTLEGHGDFVHRAAFSPDGQRIVTASNDGTARIWNVANGREEARLSHGDPVRSALFSPDNRLVLTASWDGTARLWDAGTGRPVAVLREPSGIEGAAFSPNGAWVLTLYSEAASLWDVRSATRRRQFKEAGVELTFAGFTADSRRILTADRNGRVSIWEASTGERILSFEGHEDRVEHVEISPDGKRIVTASMDVTARLWDVATGEPLAVWTGHTGSVWRAIFSPDGNRVLTSSPDGTARLWRTLPIRQKLIEEARRSVAASGPLTAEERKRFFLPADPRIVR